MADSVVHLRCLTSVLRVLLSNSIVVVAVHRCERLFFNGVHVITHSTQECSNRRDALITVELVQLLTDSVNIRHMKTVGVYHVKACFVQVKHGCTDELR